MSTSFKPAHHTPTSLAGSAKASSNISASSTQSSAAIALGMSWQLLVVIVLPIVGGHLLDTRYHTSPVWMVVGMVIGLVGTVTVVRQTILQLNDVMGMDKEEDK
ncbi:MAG TPA: AtpZ/AtpI family protein [Candidatus Saccharimonadales bacterium]|nr:AtpZ/AtpI family protein [Candidatus Saccharimonadales bacterium]